MSKPSSVPCKSDDLSSVSSGEGGIDDSSKMEFSGEESSIVHHVSVGEKMRELLRAAGQPDELIPDIDEVNSVFAGLDGFSNWFVSLSVNNVLTKEEAEFAEEMGLSGKHLSEAECNQIILDKLGVDNSSSPCLNRNILEEKIDEFRCLEDKMNALDAACSYLKDDIAKQDHINSIHEKDLASLREKHTAMIASCQNIIVSIDSNVKTPEFAAFFHNNEIFVNSDGNALSTSTAMPQQSRTPALEVMEPSLHHIIKVLKSYSTLLLIPRLDTIFIDKAIADKIISHFEQLDVATMKIKYLCSLKKIAQIESKILAKLFDETVSCTSALVRVEEAPCVETIDCGETLVNWYTQLAGSEQDDCITIDKFLSLMTSMDEELETGQSSLIERSKMLNEKLVSLLKFIEKLKLDMSKEAREVDILKLNKVFENIVGLKPSVVTTISNSQKIELLQQMYHYFWLFFTNYEKFKSKMDWTKNSVSILQKAIDCSKT